MPASRIAAWTGNPSTLRELALLQTRFFALFFVFYIGATLLLNIAWKGGWTGIAPPKVYVDDDPA
ncbi:hypothetical protein [uncultured Massilia sp.]|uniref:hypothetical protein n=1 Tax=uncultured Massilia sp. TaxID=169973 RepID=UPI0025E8C973|nr:hypothetical protein [uncultured Massilia sp.]